MIVVKTDLLMQIESLLGVLIYLVGIVGSYFRFGIDARRGKLDALFMVCITWGYCSIMVGILNIVKYTFVPSLHIEMIRVLYYGGALVSSMVFFERDFASAATKTKISAILLVSTMAFVFAEALVFYLDLSYAMAILSCVGLLLIYIFDVRPRNNVIGILTGITMILLPILPKLNQKDLQIDKLNMKRETGIRNLIACEPKIEHEERLIVDLSE